MICCTEPQQEEESPVASSVSRFWPLASFSLAPKTWRCEGNDLPSLHSPRQQYLTQQYRESHATFAHDTQGSILVSQEDDITARGVGDFVEVQESSKEGTGGVKFEKTLAAQIEKALAKEFTDADHGGAGVLGEGAGRSFNQTADSEGAVLETVVRVSRTGGGKNREVRGGHVINTLPEPAAWSNASVIDDSVTARPESLLERIGSTAKDIDRALGGKDDDEDVERLVDSSDNEFVISNPKSGTMELQQDLRLISDLVIILVSAAVGALAFTLMGQPLITGYLIAGSLVGPGGMGLVVELVQVCPLLVSRHDIKN